VALSRLMLHNAGMTAGRWVLFATVVVVGGLAVVFVFISSDVAAQVEAAVSAIAAVAAIGTGVWAALPHGSKGRDSVNVPSATRTGPATASGPGSKANSGVKGSGVAKHTGTAKATGGGSANTGVDSSG
jgi:hypothetical protein